MTRIFSVTLPALLFSAFVLASPAQAQSSNAIVKVQLADGTVQAKIRTQDLNLSSPEGQQSLDARIRKAINIICLPNLRVSMTQRGQCRINAMEEAKPQIARAIQKYQNSRLAFNNGSGAFDTAPQPSTWQTQSKK